MISDQAVRRSANAASLAARAARRPSRPGCALILARLAPGDYAAFLALCPRSPTTIATLQQMRLLVRDVSSMFATCVASGPRFLHSDRAGLQGRTQFRGLPADHLRGSRGSRGAAAALQLRRRQGGPARGDFDVLAERGGARSGFISAAISPAISTGCSRRCAAP